MSPLVPSSLVSHFERGGLDVQCDDAEKGVNGPKLERMFLGTFKFWDSTY
jgi:hypothetical protein